MADTPTRQASSREGGDARSPAEEKQITKGTASSDNARPLAGVRVVVTRPAHQADGLCAAFAAAGATVERLPLLAVVPPDDPGPLHRAAADLARYRWIAFTSANAVHALAEAAGGRLEFPAGVRTAAIGKATAMAARQAGAQVDLVSEAGRGAALAEELAAVDAEVAGDGERLGPVLLPLAADARPDLADGLRAAGYQVVEVVAYDKRAPADTLEHARRLFPPDTPLGWVTFTSPRIARTFVEVLQALGNDWPERRPTLRAASIGPTTTASLRKLGVEPSAEAASPSETDLVGATEVALEREASLFSR